MKQHLLGIIAAITVFTGLVLCISCQHHINSIDDTHFTDDGAPRDSVSFFIPTRPNSVKLFIETSGSMNGFFRANQSNKFKKTVWSVFSGLQHLTDNSISPLSKGGDIDSPISFGTFKNSMNAGTFVSGSETHIPLMLANIISRIDPTKDEVAILVSDMKYSPMGKDASPAIAQYQEEIRNLTARHNYGVAFVCADSEFINKNGEVVEDHSPYYYIIIGKPENVAAIRNDIVNWCENTDSFIDSGDMGMNYKIPSYTIHDVKNGVLSEIYSHNLITGYERGLSDTCSFILRVDLTGFPCNTPPQLLDSCLNAYATNGADIIREVLDVKDDHHAGRQFEREAYVDYLIKVFNFPLDDEVVEWSFNPKWLDAAFTPKFFYIINGQSESELDRTFSFNKFIEGHHNGRLNEYSLEPGLEKQAEPKHIRILISHNY